jgi:hypothetical protein
MLYIPELAIRVESMKTLNLKTANNKREVNSFVGVLFQVKAIQLQQLRKPMNNEKFSLILKIHTWCTTKLHQRNISQQAT